MRSVLTAGLLLLSMSALAYSVPESFSAALASAKAAADQDEACMTELKTTGRIEACRFFSKSHDVYKVKLRNLQSTLSEAKGGPEAAASEISSEDWTALKNEGKKIQLTIDYVDSYAEFHK